MSDFGKYNVHPAAAEFPLLDDERMAELVASVRERGIIHPIMLTADGKTIVEGRNRYLACIKAGVEPRFKTLPSTMTEADIIQYIADANLQRRDLEAGQRAVIFLALNEQKEKALADEAKERQREGGKQKVAQTSGQAKRAERTDDKLAKQAKVSHDSISRARKVRDHSKRLADEVKSGTKTLDEAYKEISRQETEAQAIKENETPSANMTIVRTHDGRQTYYPLPKGKVKFNKTNDQVSWAGYTWNVVTGCLHNCPYCYAREGAVMNKNLKQFYPFGFEPTFFDYRLEAPYNSKVPDEARNDPRLGRVFVSSMGDLFGKWVRDEEIEKVFAAARANPEWEYLFLTKFPQRYVGLKPPPTAWLGTTVDEQYRVKIAEEAFRKIDDDVRVKWLSVEPLRAPLEFTDLSMFDWIVIGAQSATDQPDGHVKEFAPPFEWVARLIAKARECGVPVYCKPNLLGIPNPQSPGMKLPQELPRCFHDRACAIFRGSACDCVPDVSHGGDIAPKAEAAE
jgi:protein gp37/ParB-like chromosome segregation protein Spo0J